MGAPVPLPARSARGRDVLARPTLVCTTHDPDGLVLRLATDESLRAILDVFDAFTLACSPETTGEVERSLGRSGIVVVRRGGERLDLYRAALAAGAEGHGHLLYADFDRLLHWQRAYPAELATAAETAARADFTLFGRTKRAFASHPACQRLTEGPVNELFRHLFRLAPETDIFASCWGLSRGAAAHLLDAPVAAGTAFYALWPAMLLRAGFGFRFSAVEGLEWETPDAHGDEIARLGYEAWLATFESARQWNLRSEMSAQWIVELLRLWESSPELRT